jgi:hypothetical protein
MLGKVELLCEIYIVQQPWGVVTEVRPCLLRGKWYEMSIIVILHLNFGAN